MTSIEFKNWLLGYLEDKDILNEEQVNKIKEKANEVYDPIDFNPPPIVPLHPMPTPIMPNVPYPPYNPTCPTVPYPWQPDIWYGNTTAGNMTNNFNLDEELDKENNDPTQEKDD